MIASSDPWYRASYDSEVAVLQFAKSLKGKGESLLATARADLGRLVKAKGRRTIANTLEPYNHMMMAVSEVGLQGQVLFNAHTKKSVRDMANKIYEAAESFATEASLNRPLYEAFAALDVSRADRETKFAVTKILRDFRRAGVDRDEATRKRIKTLNDEIVSIGSAFDRNINDDVRSIELASRDELDGLPQDYIEAHAPRPDGKIRITTQYPDALPVFAYARRAEVRKALLFQFQDRGYPKNLEVLATLLEKRHELATLLKYTDYADYVTEDKMIGSASNAAEFIARIANAAQARTDKDFVLLLERKRTDSPWAPNLDPWDPNFYIDRVRAEQFAFDAQEVRPYLRFEDVREGLFAITGKLFGVRYRRVPGVPVWHDSVEVFDVLEGRRRLGRIYLDLHPREGKYGHAAMFGVIVGIRGVQLPQAALLCNFPDPAKTNGPALMDHGDVVTFFHEFGHLIHGILSGTSKWTRTAMDGIEWDFVEAPSQMLEEWARRPESLRLFAKHVDTGEPIPDDLVARMERAQAVGRGLLTVRQVTFAALSLAFYRADPGGLDTTALAKEIYAQHYPVPWYEGTHFQCNFGHLNGYSAIYYTYLWSLVIAKDLFGEFRKSKTILDPRPARRYRKEILEAASRVPARKMIESFLGRPTSFDAFEAWLNEAA